MARRVVTRGRSIISSQRRGTQWLFSADSTGTQAIGAGASVFDQSFAFAEPATIVRTRGTLWVASDQNAANEQPFGALGMAVVTDQAAAIGVTAIPTPITDEGSANFFLWIPWLADFRITSTFVAEFNTFQRYEFDSKAMRKVDDGDTAVVTLENASASDGMLYIVKFRMLVKLHR